MNRAALGLSILLLTGAALPAAAMEPSKALAKVSDTALPKVLEGTIQKPGLLPVYVDNKGGRILLSLPAPDQDGISGRYIYVASLKTGLGSAPISLDHASSTNSSVIVFRRVGKKIVVEIENLRFRATNASASEQAAARESFAYSTIWMGDIADEMPDGRLLVDISTMLTRDAMGIIATLKNGGGGDFRIAPELTIADPSSVRVFPENIEMEARQTFLSADPKAEVNNIAPERGNLSFVVRHSLVKLPDLGYQPRRLDPRTGTFGTQVLDYAAPLGSPIVYDLVNRFRLEKTDPSAPRSRVKKPIIFYIDRAAPEPIRTALLEGASWWKQAFEKAGFIDAYRVEILPEGVDPLDIRYNVVNWVNRATRGWSYGLSISDPRTGETIKGMVLLGSLRVRQDMLIFEGLVGADKVGTGGPNDPIQASLARLRQLAAHEVGHALGFEHNFAGSTQGRYSVMDYPAPRISLVNGKPDLGDAYGTGLGRWDDFAVDWLYGTDSEDVAKTKASAAIADGLRFVGDSDARPINSAQPIGSLWDDGADPVTELERMVAVRRAAVERFGLPALAAGEPVANLRRKFVPIWLVHRYQIEAAAKLVGGIDFTYSIHGDGQETSKIVAPADQRRALDALLATLEPAELQIPPSLLPLLSAGFTGNSDRQTDIEIFRTAGGTIFDPLAASEAAATVTINALLAPERLNRLEQQKSIDNAQLGADELIDRLLDSTFLARPNTIQRRIATTTVLLLARVQRNRELSPTLALMLDERLRRLAAQLTKMPGDNSQRDWGRSLSHLLTTPEALEKALTEQRPTPFIPPGMPIGGAEND